MAIKKAYGPRSALTSFLKEHGITNKMMIRRMRQNASRAQENSELATEDSQNQAQDTSSVHVLQREQNDSDVSIESSSSSSESESDGPISQRISTRSSKTSTKLEKPTSSSSTKSSKKKVHYESDAPESSKKTSKKSKIPAQGLDQGLDSGSSRKGGIMKACEMCNVRVLLRNAVSKGNAVYCKKCAKSIEKAHANVSRKEAQVIKVDPKKTKRYTKRTVQKKVIKSEGGLLQLETGIPSLQDMCVRIIGKNIDMVESFGDISANSLNKVSRIICKLRMLSQDNLKLFLGPTRTELNLYDCTYLDGVRLANIAQFSPNLNHLNLNFCGQIRDEQMIYYADRLQKLTSISIYGPFLVSDSAFSHFFDSANTRLTSFKIGDAQFGPGAVKALTKNCSNMISLSFERCHAFDDSCVRLLAGTGAEKSDFIELSASSSTTHKTDLENVCCKFPKLTSLCILETPNSLSSESLIILLKALGENLEELRITNCSGVDDDFLIHGIAKYCRNLLVLDISGSNVTSKGLCDLFDASSDSNTMGSTDARTFGNSFSTGLNTIGLGNIPKLSDSVLYSVLKHSSSSLYHLNIHSADQRLTKDGLRAIAGICPEEPKLNDEETEEPKQQDEANGSNESSNDQLVKNEEHLIAPILLSSETNRIKQQNANSLGLYPCKKLETLNISFVRASNDEILNDIIKSCPKLNLVYVNGDPNVTAFVSKRGGLTILGRESDTL